MFATLGTTDRQDTIHAYVMKLVASVFQCRGFRTKAILAVDIQNRSLAIMEISICFAIPSGDEPPVVLDAATCIMADDQRGPEFDALFSIIPAAFFKSIGYTAVANLLGGGLTGFTESSPEDTAKWSNGRMGRGMVLAIHIESVVRSNVFHAEVDRMARDVRETYEPMPGTDRALLPGAIEIERTEQHHREGIRYGEMEQEAARVVSERLGVPLSWDE